MSAPGRADPEPWRLDPESWRLEVHACLPSTADLCRARAEAGEADGLAILALRQSTGKGTHGRSWADCPGNLALSVLWRPGGPAVQAGCWGLLAGVAVAEALATFLPPEAPLTLKWPNDVLLGGGKIVGILAESVATAEGTLEWLSFGIGANLAMAPEVPGRRTACLAAYGAPPPPRQAAAGVRAALARWRDRVAREGFAPVRDAFLQRAPRPGTPLSLHRGAENIVGRFAGLDSGGALLLHTSQGLRTFVAGEVTSQTGGAA